VYSRSKVGSGALALGLFSIISSGCAAGISSHPHGLGAGQWNVSLPAAASYSQGLAYGRGGSSARAESADETLFAEARTAPLYGEETKKRQVQRKRRVDPAQPTRSEPVTPSPEQMQLAPPTGKQSREEIAFEPAAEAPSTQLAMADTSAVGRYETREAKSQSQQQFRGGDAIVIGASTLVIVILIVLLVLLLV
jgi:hypothetical protein